jgi:DNA-binding response OmpR family regulator
METEDAGFHVVRAARKQPYNPATAMLTAYPQSSGHWKQEGAQSLLVKPVGTEDLLRQIEALLVRHEDEKHHPSQLKDTAGQHVSSSNREGGRKAS